MDPKSTKADQTWWITNVLKTLYLVSVMVLLFLSDTKSGRKQAPLYVYYAMHLVHSPLCVPEGYLEKFEFIRDADDNVNHDRQYVAAMVCPPRGSSFPVLCTCCLAAFRSSKLDPASYDFQQAPTAS